MKKILILALSLLLALPLISAVCEEKVIYYGSCSPDGALEIWNDRNPSQTYTSTCFNGFYVASLGPAGSDPSCAIESSNNNLFFEINNAGAGADIWTSGILQRLDLVQQTTNAPPSISASFNNGNPFKVGENVSCSAIIKDNDGTLSEVYVRAESAVNRINYTQNWSTNMLSGKCLVSSNSASANCTSDIMSFYYPAGDIECIFFARDNDGDFTEIATVEEITNTNPTLIMPTLTYTVPYTSQISVKLDVYDPDVEENHSYSTQFNKGLLDSQTGLFTWTPSTNDTGNYSVSYTVIDKKGASDSKIINFEIKGGGSILTIPPAPSCSDGQQNQNETGVDCGGLCSNSCINSPSGSSGLGLERLISESTASSGGGTCITKWLPEKELSKLCIGNEGKEIRVRDFAALCPNQTLTDKTVFRIRDVLCPSKETCFDGILNQGEQNVDCGGPCQACASCSDGKKNQGEKGIDCGGPCSNICASCSDGILNQGEEEIDCGGPICASCQKPLPQEPSRLWLWILLILFAVIVIGTAVYELEKRNIIPKLITKAKEATPVIEAKEIEGEETEEIEKMESKEKAVNEKLTISASQLKSRIKEAEKMLKQGKHDELKNAVKEIVKGYDKLNPEERSHIYSEYMKLYDKIHAE